MNQMLPADLKHRGSEFAWAEASNGFCPVDQNIPKLGQRFGARYPNGHADNRNLYPGWPRFT